VHYNTAAPVRLALVITCLQHKSNCQYDFRFIFFVSYCSLLWSQWPH